MGLFSKRESAVDRDARERQENLAQIEEVYAGLLAAARSGLTWAEVYEDIKGKPDKAVYLAMHRLLYEVAKQVLSRK